MRRPPWRWRTSVSGCVTTPVAAPTTCTGSTETWPPPEPSLSAVSTHRNHPDPRARNCTPRLCGLYLKHRTHLNRTYKRRNEVKSRSWFKLCEESHLDPGSEPGWIICKQVEASFSGGSDLSHVTALHIQLICTFTSSFYLAENVFWSDRPRPPVTHLHLHRPDAKD